MNVSMLNPVGLTTEQLQSAQQPLQNGNRMESPEKAFEMIFMQLLTQGLTTTGSEDGSLFGMKGPWKNLLISTLSENLADSQTMGFGRLLMDSTNDKI